MVVCLVPASRVLPGGRVLLVMLWAGGGGWWWWLWLDCLVVVVSAGGSVCGGGWARLVVVMVCPCGWCWVWYHWACGLRLLSTHLSGWRRPGGPVVRPAGGAGCSRVSLDGGCSVAGRGWVHCRAHTRPSGRRLFRSRQGLGSLPGAHTSVRTAAVS